MDPAQKELGKRLPMLQRDNDEHEVPLDWHTPFDQIVRAFLEKDFRLFDQPIDCVEPIDHSTAKSIAGNIAAYGAALAPLNIATWERSIYRWMDGYWQFLVDLTTDKEDVSDLTLHARLDDAPAARLQVQSVHVP
jgi:hypothetical protein